MYELLRSFYGRGLANHLYGMDANNTYTNKALYSTIGLTLFLSTAFFVIIYYFVLNTALRTSKYNSGWWWGGFWVACIVFNFFIGFYLPYLDWDNGDILNKTIADNMTTDAIVGFGIVNALYAAMLFFGLSWIVKRWSTNASTIPFPKM